MSREMPLDAAEIRELLPHRYPMLLVDRVVSFDPTDKIVGLKNVTANEQFFQGHFPDRPIMPGVLILEALAQMGVLYAKLTPDGMHDDGLVVFAAADAVKWRKPVVPGDQVILEMELLRRRAGIWKMKGTAHVDGELVAEAILTAAAAPK